MNRTSSVQLLTALLSMAVPAHCSADYDLLEAGTSFTVYIKGGTISG